MRFPFFDSSTRSKKILIIPDGVKSNVFVLSNDGKLQRFVFLLEDSEDSKPNIFAFAPWLEAREQFFYKIKSQIKDTSDSMLTVAFPTGVCRLVSTSFRLNRHRPSDKIEEREIQNQVYSVMQEARENLRKELINEGGGSFVLIDVTMADFKIDDFAVNNPVGLRGNVVEAKLIAIFVFAEAVNFAENLAQSLGVKFLHQTSFAALVVPSISSMFKNDKIGCGILFREQATDILMFVSGTLKSVHTISMGRNDFVKIIAETFALPFIEADRALLADAQGLLSRSMSNRIRKVLNSSTKQWLSALEIILNEKIVKNNILPSRLVFCGSASFPRDIIMNLGLSSPEHESSRTIIQPENLFYSIAQKELSQFNLVNLVYPWIAAKVDKQKAIIGPALILKVFPTVNRV